MFRNDPPAARRSLLAIVAAFVLAGALYGFSSPMFETSDEVRHVAMVEHYAQGSGFPVQDPANLAFYEQEGSQAPLYYLLMAPVARLAGLGDFRTLAQFNPHSKIGRADATNNWNMLVHREDEWSWPWRDTTLAMILMRALGVALGAVTVVGVYGLARALARGNLPDAAPALAAGLVAFNPMFVYISASVNNDTLVVALSTLTLWLAAESVNGGVTARRAWAIGALIGAAALTKSSALALAAVVPLAVLAAALVRGKTIRQLAPLGVFMALPIIAIAGWWYVRNQVLYGDVTGTMMQAVIDGLRDPPITVVDALGEWTGFRQAFWGLFGAVNIPLPVWVYTALDVFALVGLAGLIGFAVDAFRRRRAAAAPNIILAMCGAVLGLNVLALIRWTMLTYASQGRLLFPSIAVIASFVALGMMWLASRLGLAVWSRLRPGAQGPSPLEALYSPRLTAAHLAPFALLAFAAPLAFIAPAYARPPRGLTEAQLPPDLARTELRFGDAIRWMGYRVAPESSRLAPGDALDVTLYWQALKPMEANYSAGLRLFGVGGVELALLDTYPGGGMLPTSQWRPGEIIADRYRLRLEPAAEVVRSAPTALSLDIGVWNVESKQFLATFDGQGNPTGRQRYEVAGLTTGAPPAKALPAGAHLQKVHLERVTTELSAPDATGRRALVLLLDWLPTDDFGRDEDNTVFVHLFDAQGRKIAQADARPRLPTRWWRAFERVPGDAYTLDLPAGLAPGRYLVKFGQYRPSDGARMPAFDAAGKPIDDAALSVTVELP